MLIRTLNLPLLLGTVLLLSRFAFVLLQSWQHSVAHYTLLQRSLFIQHCVTQSVQRAGFLMNADPIRVPPIVLGAAPSMPTRSCVIATYDPALKTLGLSVGYRLYQQRLQYQRGGQSCTSGHWEALLDPEEVTIRQFTLTWLPSQRGLEVTLVTSSPRLPHLTHRLLWIISLRNEG